jgi:hypothetical protein
MQKHQTTKLETLLCSMAISHKACFSLVLAVKCSMGGSPEVCSSAWSESAFKNRHPPMLRDMPPLT